MQQSLFRKFAALMLSILAILLALILAYLTLYALDAITLLQRPILAENVDEIFARVFLLWPFAIFAVLFLLSPTVRRPFLTQRWLLIMAILFVLGAAFALGDPIHPVRAEYNFIRYWTSGALTLGGIICIVGSVSGVRPVSDRFFGIFFCVLLFAAAGDELFQFHEVKGRQLTASMPETAILQGSDTVTLSVALLGVIIVILAVFAARYLPWAKEKMEQPRYRRTFWLLALGVVILMTAMVLDSFDFYLEDLSLQLRASIFGFSEPGNVPLWFSDNFVMAASNSIEELFEYLAALCFLMAVSFLFSVKALGCELPSDQPIDGRSVAA